MADSRKGDDETAPKEGEENKENTTSSHDSDDIKKKEMKNAKEDKKAKRVSSAGTTRPVIDVLAKTKDSAKMKEREERVKQMRGKQEQERQKKLEELRESQKLAQEFRDKQQKERQKKIEEMRKKDEERRQGVEERRKKTIKEEKSRLATIIKKTSGRESRIDQMRNRRSGAFFAFGSSTPRNLHGDELDASKRAFSTANISMNRSYIPSSTGGDVTDNEKLERRVKSAWQLAPTPTSPSKNLSANRNRLSVTKHGSSSDISPPMKKHLSASTPALCKKKTDEINNGSGNVNSRHRSTGGRLRTSFHIPQSQRPHSCCRVETAPQYVFIASPSPRARKRRPHSVTGRLPSSASSSTPSTPPPSHLAMFRQSRSIERKALGEHARTQQHLEMKPLKPEIRKSIDRLAQPKSSSVKSAVMNKKDKDSTKDKEKEKEKPSAIVKPQPKVNDTFFERLSHPKNRPPSPAKKDEVVSQVPTRQESKPENLVKLVERLSHPKVKTDKVSTVTAPDKVKNVPVIKVTPTRDTSQKRVNIVDKAKVNGDLGMPEKQNKESVDDTLKKGAESRTTVEYGGAGDIGPSKDDNAIKKQTKSPTGILKKKSGEKPSSLPLVTFALEQDEGQMKRSSSSKDVTEEEYKQKMAEKRKQAREGADKKIEEERLRQEELLRQEEEKKRREEEEQRLFEEEQARLAEEARTIEEERLKKAIEAEEQRKKEEAEKLEMEKKIKEETELKAKEDIEKKEKEKQERLKKEEEERLERKKRLEMIMKRVKTDSPETTKVESRSGNTSPTPVSSTQGTVTQADSADSSGEDTPKFKSPLLQSLLGNRAKRGSSPSREAASPRGQSPVKESDQNERASSPVITNAEQNETVNSLKSIEAVNETVPTNQGISDTSINGGKEEETIVSHKTMHDSNSKVTSVQTEEADRPGVDSHDLLPGSDGHGTHSILTDNGSETNGMPGSDGHGTDSILTDIGSVTNGSFSLTGVTTEETSTDEAFQPQAEVRQMSPFVTADIVMKEMNGDNHNEGLSDLKRVISSLVAETEDDSSQSQSDLVLSNQVIGSSSADSSGSVLKSVFQQNVEASSPIEDSEVSTPESSASSEVTSPRDLTQSHEEEPLTHDTQFEQLIDLSVANKNVIVHTNDLNLNNDVLNSNNNMDSNGPISVPLIAFEEKKQTDLLS